MQAYAIYQGIGNSFRIPRFSAVLSKVAWKYRGQIIPSTKYMQLDLHVKNIIKKKTGGPDCRRKFMEGELKDL
ncbi:MAG: hypothetical protein CM1200mP30_12930 [Pseudomonadota bacterium]|nr:MAG: hypothetical protein CM1200mP30_12930 [Pseudomonadota bacterium]